MAEQTPITELPLPHFLKVALADNGYKTVDDLTRSTAVDLSIELSIGVPQAEDVLRQAQTLTAGPSRAPQASPDPAPAVSQVHSSTASELLRPLSRIRFSTMSVALDELIGHFAPPRLLPSDHGTLNLKGKQRASAPLAGPIAPGMVLEVSSPPGGGKTSVAIAVALSARLLETSADELLQGSAEEPVRPPEVLIIDVRDVVDGIHLIRVATQVQMISLLHTLEAWIEAHPEVLGKIATVYGCAIVVTNQLATKLLTAANKPANFETGDRAVLMPQLGETWTTDRTVRVALFRGPPGDDLRYAHASAASTTGMGSGLQNDIPWAQFDIDSNLGLPSYA
ncbi:uncharacterized protein LOC62_03G004706 [Vanrija pseudolonga]|uniref:DNA recombination and repair protein Rad51-like C-terminal domain-containing protein n=1 Tax=Vanrija pseudolonga TaxID=143232 RepID=A0AAF1BHJ2_9TREE|nr:hypothetical protein LOC62_03G004706 [Vanrija pseudolonga]